jgi:hypothetical protein
MSLLLVAIAAFVGVTSLVGGIALVELLDVLQQGRSRHAETHEGMAPNVRANSRATRRSPRALLASPFPPSAFAARAARKARPFVAHQFARKRTRLHGPSKCASRLDGPLARTMVHVKCDESPTKGH